MAQQEEEQEQQQHHQNKKLEEEEVKKLLSSYIGISFYVFLALLPSNAVHLVPRVRSQLREAEEEVREIRRRRQEDSRANARAVEIFATHRNAWRKQENRLLRRIDAAADEIASLRARVKELEEKAEEGLGGCGSRECRDECVIGMGANGMSSSSSSSSNVVDVIYQHTPQYQQQQQQLQLDNGFEFDSEFLASASKFWPPNSSLSLCQVNYLIFLNLFPFLSFFFSKKKGRKSILMSS